jgi:predicted transcriptional regulator
MSSRTVSVHWTFLTNHSRVLLCLAQDPNARMRDVADSVGITERAAQRVFGDLLESGYVDRIRNGRRNRYHVNRGQTLRHAAQLGQEIGSLLDLLEPNQPTR